MKCRRDVIRNVRVGARDCDVSWDFTIDDVVEIRHGERVEGRHNEVMHGQVVEVQHEEKVEVQPESRLTISPATSSVMTATVNRINSQPEYDNEDVSALVFVTAAAADVLRVADTAVVPAVTARCDTFAGRPTLAPTSDDAKVVARVLL